MSKDPVPPYGVLGDWGLIFAKYAEKPLRNFSSDIKKRAKAIASARFVN